MSISSEELFLELLVNLTDIQDQTVIVLLLFGGKKIPELMRGLGRGVREFNDAKNNVQSEIRKGMDEDPNKNKSEA